jgi:hypothetical protein
LFDYGLLNYQKYTMSLPNEMPKELRNWVVTQFFNYEAGLLTEEQREKFLKLVEENQNHPDIVKCFKIFYKFYENLELHRDTEWPAGRS